MFRKYYIFSERRNFSINNMLSKNNEKTMNDKIKYLQTPCYILDERKLENNFSLLCSEFKKAWGDTFVVGYSFKTNSLPYVLSWMKKQGAYAEVVSETEYLLARKLEFPIDKIILNGPVKGKSAILEVLNGGGIVNLDSFSEIELLTKEKPVDGKVWKVGLRINFDLENECPGETLLGNLPGRFGFNIENNSLHNAIEEIKKLKYVKICGFHGHHSTKTKSLKIFRTICNKLSYVADLFEINCEYIDVGGCIFGDKPGAPSFKDYAEVISNELRKCVRFKDAYLILEPGAGLVASPFSYLTKIVDVKSVRNTLIATSNGSLIHIDPQMHGILFQTKLFSTSDTKKEYQIVAGFTCIEKDRLAELFNAPSLQKDDLIMYYNTGAYSLALAPLFIQYYPTVYVYKDSEFIEVRNKWSVEEYLMKSEVL